MVLASDKVYGKEIARHNVQNPVPKLGMLALRGPQVKRLLVQGSIRVQRSHPIRQSRFIELR
jgi:hypothetical protein